MRGQVIGIVTVKVTNGQNINLALGSARIGQLRDGQLISFDQVSVKNRSNQPEALADLWYRGGIDSMWLGNYENALNYFETAANRNPRRPETWIQIGYCKVKQGRNEEAIRAISARFSSDQTHPTLTAETWRRAFSMPVALMKRLPLISRPRNNPKTRKPYNLALAYLEIGDREAAHDHPAADQSMRN
jgi:tetratricopeptide (TPR) repeat protein